MENKRIANLFVEFRKLLRSYTDFQLAELKEFDLSPNEIAVLSAVNDFSLASDIAVNTGVSKALVSRSVKELTQKGLITRVFSEVDKREQMLALTETGVRVAMLIEEVNDRFFHIIFKDISDTEQAVLFEIMKFVQKNIDETNRM